MGALKNGLRRRHTLVIDNASCAWRFLTLRDSGLVVGGLFIGRMSRQLSKVVIIYDHYFNINGEFWLKYNAFRMCRVRGRQTFLYYK